MNFFSRFLFILAFVFSAPVQAAASAEPLLFKRIPALHEKIGWVSLGEFPTPTKPLTKIGEVVGHPHLWMKNDCTATSGEWFGGNKVRKLEFLLGDALKKGYKDVITWGYAGSNHTCATAVHARRVGLGCRIHHGHQAPTAYARRNLARTHKEGASLALYETFDDAVSAVDSVDEVYKATNPLGYYRIHSGGSNALGTLGFVEAALELKEQIDAGIMPEPDVIYVAMGSCASAAGLALGAKIAGLKSIIVAVLVEPDEPAGFYRAKTERLFHEAASILASADESFASLKEKVSGCIINYDYSGAGYGVTISPAADAIKLMHEKETIKLDGTYAGKAFAAVLEDTSKASNHEKVILFWNTFFAGDAGADLEHFDYHVLPAAYERYFTDRKSVV